MNQMLLCKGRSKTSSVQPKPDKHFPLIVLCELETCNQLSVLLKTSEKYLAPFSFLMSEEEEMGDRLTKKISLSDILLLT